MIQSITQGRPTKPQVDKFIELFKSHKEGDVISHEEIEDAVGVKRKSDPSRYRTIVAASMKRILCEYGVKLSAVGCGQGYKYPTGTEQLSVSGRMLRSHVRGTCKAINVAAVIADARLDDKGKASRDFYVCRGRELAEIARRESSRMRLSCGTTPVLPK
jgi:hypothetical protein